MIGKQAADEDPAYEGKETFVTGSYRKKMVEERKRWAKEEEDRTRREEEEDAKLR